MEESAKMRERKKEGNGAPIQKKIFTRSQPAGMVVKFAPLQ